MASFFFSILPLELLDYSHQSSHGKHQSYDGDVRVRSVGKIVFIQLVPTRTATHSVWAMTAHTHHPEPLCLSDMAFDMELDDEESQCMMHVQLTESEAREAHARPSWPCLLAVEDTPQCTPCCLDSRAASPVTCVIAEPACIRPESYQCVSHALFDFEDDVPSEQYAFSYVTARR